MRVKIFLAISALALLLCEDALAYRVREKGLALADTEAAEVG